MMNDLKILAEYAESLGLTVERDWLCFTFSKNGKSSMILIDTLLGAGVDLGSLSDAEAEGPGRTFFIPLDERKRMIAEIHRQISEAR
jgi:hypothetical protein